MDDDFELYRFLTGSVKRWHHEEEPLLDDRFENELHNTIFYLRRKLVIEKHHVIPISLNWHDLEINKLELPAKIHTELHKIQNISQKKIRRFREEINHIIWTWEYYDLYSDLLTLFFKNSALSWVEDLQKEAVKRQGVECPSNELGDIIWAYIDKQIIEQKSRIMKVYLQKEKF